MFHQVGQIVMVVIIYQLPSMVNYLPVLLITGCVSGFLVAFISKKILELLNRIFQVKNQNVQEKSEISK